MPREPQIIKDRLVICSHVHLCKISFKLTGEPSDCMHLSQHQHGWRHCVRENHCFYIGEDVVCR